MTSRVVVLRMDLAWCVSITVEGIMRMCGALQAMKMKGFEKAQIAPSSPLRRLTSAKSRASLD